MTLINLMRKTVALHDAKQNISKDDPVYMCTNFNTRNRYKNEKYKIPENLPQCPIYNDNRCCGGCKFAATCDHCVNCGCYGFTYARMGGNDENYYLHKSSEYYGVGRLNKDGKFDWDYYYYKKFKPKGKIGKYVVINYENKKYVAKINSKVKSDYSFKVHIYDVNITKKIYLSDVPFKTVYNTYEDALKEKQIYNM